MDNATDYLTRRLFRSRQISEDGCWEWTDRRTQRGYGLLTLPVHRVAAILWLSLQLGGDRYVCHSCDNPACFNPEHLYLGSAAENAQDRTHRGRGRENDQRGRKNPNVKLTEGDVAEIIRLVREEGVPQGKVAAQFGIVQPHVSRIVRGAAWRSS